MKTSHHQQLFITILALAKMPILIAENTTVLQNALPLSEQLTLSSAKLDSTGFVIELVESKQAILFLNTIIDKMLVESDTYGIKRYANRKTIALRVSLTGSI